MDSALKNLQKSVCHITQQTNKPNPTPEEIISQSWREKLQEE